MAASFFPFLLSTWTFLAYCNSEKPNCPVGFEAVGDYCYDLLNRTFGQEENPSLNWWSAKDVCKLKGGDLVFVEDVDEVALLQYYMKYHLRGNCTDVFFGGYDIYHEGEWRWEHDASLLAPPLTNWASSQPGNNGNLNCLAASCSVDYRWTARGCLWDDTFFMCKASSL